MKLIVVIPCYNEELVIKKTANVISCILEHIKDDGKITEYEIVFVDDGSSDKTWKFIEEFNSTTIRGLKLSRNVGHQGALWAGYEYAQDKCDMVISIDADLQQDPDAMTFMVDKFLEGYDVIYGVRKNRLTDNFFKRISSSCFYKIIHFLDGNILPNHADFRLLSNRACKLLVSYPERNIFIRGLVRTLGFKECIVYFDVKERAYGESKYSISKMLNLAIDGITSFSVRPLRMITVLGVLIMITAFITAIYVFVSYVGGKGVPGWSSLLLSIWFLGGIQIFVLGIIGEYIGKIYKEVKHRPIYCIEKII